MILSGVVASSGGGFSATGGTFTVDANGYRHHIFHSSGTLSVSGVSDIHIVSQNGGGLGSGSVTSAGNNPTWPEIGITGFGGAGGAISYSTGIAQGNISVTVGAAGGSSGVNISTTSYLSRTPGTTLNSGLRFTPPNTLSLIGANATPAEQPTHASVASFLDSLANIPPRAGGSGGSGGAFGSLLSGSTLAQPRTFGGLSGGGNGGEGSSQGRFNGDNGSPNSGGGGGGGGIAGFQFSSDIYQWGTMTTSGVGGSGYVVISYQL
jgi:hypothetical protein